MLMKTAYRNANITGALWQGALIVLIAAALSLGVNYFRRDGLPLVSHGPGKASSSTSEAGREQVVSIEEARALFLTNGAVFIDARPEEAYRSGHIRGPSICPRTASRNRCRMSRRKSRPIRSSSPIATAKVAPSAKRPPSSYPAKGYSHVQVLVNGWSAWQDAGLPAEKSLSETILLQ